LLKVSSFDFLYSSLRTYNAGHKKPTAKNIKAQASPNEPPNIKPKNQKNIEQIM